MTSVDRRYLRARDLRTPQDAARNTRETISEWKSVLIKTSLGQEFKYTARVAVVRPAWMPRRLYRWLLNTVIVESLPIAEKSTR